MYICIYVYMYMDIYLQVHPHIYNIYTYIVPILMYIRPLSLSTFNHPFLHKKTC
jgi:hypothetical protein